MEKLNITKDLNPEWVKRVIDEMQTNDFEKRYVWYSITDEEWERFYSYLSDYLYEYMFANDSLNRIVSSELFSFIMGRFEGRAKASLGITDKSSKFLKHRKYSYVSGRGSEIPMIFQSLKLAKEDRILPKFASSFVFEFYQRGSSL